jgi:hypothetical protein
MVPLELKADSWQRLSRFLEEILPLVDPSETTFLFRGQSDQSWPLRPSLARLAATAGFQEEDSRRLEMAALKEFQSQAHQFLPIGALPRDRDDVLSWWVLMQHYGAPTRLLDWTASPYVATYFAVLAEPDKDGAVWLVQPRPVNDWMDQQFGENKLNADVQRQRAALLDPQPKAILTFFQPSLETDRMSAQRTHFSVSGLTTADHGEIIAGTVEPAQARNRFAKILIPAKLKLPFLRQLRELNVTARTLFPGIDGLGRSIAELLRLGVYQALRQAPRP